MRVDSVLLAACLLLEACGSTAAPDPAFPQRPAASVPVGTP